jgi:hypothetical protein
VQSYRSLKATSKKYSHNDFTTGVYMVDLLKALLSSSVFGRGLSTMGYLQNESYAQVFRQVIQEGGLVVPQHVDQLGDVSEKNPLQICFERGWLYNEAINPAEVIYTFPSPLHMRYMQWVLLGNQDEAIISENSIIDFVIEVIHEFIPLNLSAE